MGHPTIETDPEWKKGSAELLVLSLLEAQPRHGYDISKLIEVRSGGALTFHVTSLYPLLHRLGRLGYVTTEWRSPPEGRRRRYYVITDDGRAALAEQQRQWVAVTQALGDVWRGPGRLNTALGEV